MIIVDSSVWVDYFNGIETPETNKLDELLGIEAIAIGDLILTLPSIEETRDFICNLLKD